MDIDSRQWQKKRKKCTSQVLPSLIILRLNLITIRKTLNYELTDSDTHMHHCVYITYITVVTLQPGFCRKSVVSEATRGIRLGMMMVH